jgi:hypothetical protein
MRAIRIGLVLSCLAVVAAGFAPEAIGQDQPAKPAENLKVTSRPAPDAPPFTDADRIDYTVYRRTDGGAPGEKVDTGYGSIDSAAWFSLPPGGYVVVASTDLARAGSPIDITGNQLATVDIVLPAAVIEARAMASAEKPIFDNDTRWTVIDVFGRKAESIGPTLDIKVSPGETKVTAGLGTAKATAVVNAAGATTEKVDVVINLGTLLLSGKRSAEANELDDNIRWEVTPADTEPLTDYGTAKFNLAAGTYRVKGTIGLAEGYAEVPVAAGETVAKEFVVPAGRATVRALFAENGPPVTDNPLFEILDPDPGADGERKVIASSRRDGDPFDLAPGDYVLRATAEKVSAETPFRLEAGQTIRLSVVLDAGVLALSSKESTRFDVLAAEKDIYGKQAVLATHHGDSATLTLRAGAYEVKTTRGGSERRFPVTIVAGQRADLSVE